MMDKACRSSADRERRVLVLASTNGDGAITVKVLSDAGINAVRCTSANELYKQARCGAGVLVLAEEALAGVAPRRLTTLLDEQPAWSDIPIVVLTSRRRGSIAPWRVLADLPSIRNATLLERPMRMETLVQAVRVALRGRERQFQLRDHIGERERMLAYSETLLRELQHRVKNNLQMVQSLVHMSAKRVSDESKSHFNDVMRRIWAIGHLHSRIYAEDKFSQVNIAGYISDIADHAVTGFGAINERVRIVKHLQPVSVEVDIAIPIGLVATELLTNALKYAFPGERPGEVRIELSSQAGCTELTIADNGVGVLGDRVKASTGLRIVEALAAQVQGEFEMHGNGGTRCTLRFPADHPIPQYA